MSTQDFRLERNACASGQALVLASWEKNRPTWRDGGFFELRSHKRRLQETVAAGGDLWIVISRPSASGRIYTLSFRLRNCKARDYAQAGKFGQHAVVGDPEQSRFFAASDARLLLLALRFDPNKPINGPDDNQISNSLRVPRCLGRSDVKLLEHHAAHADRWGVFVSYQQQGDLKAAEGLSDALQGAGVSVFRDQETLRGGDKWWPTVKRAIRRSRRLVVVIGRSTHRSTWVKEEVQFALKEKVRVVPVLNGGKIELWDDLAKELDSLHALDLSKGADHVVEELLLAYGSAA